MSAPNIECRQVCLRLRGAGEQERLVLDQVSARFEAAQISLIEGAMGSGKSSLLSMLAGLRRPSSGEILVAEQPVSRWTAPHRDLFRQRVGLVFQDPRLLPELSAVENVLLSLLPFCSDLDQQREVARAALERAGCAHLRDQSAAQLSGGEQQRVSLARAIARAPDILLLDEPSAHQDDEGVEVLCRILNAAQADGACVVVASHDPRLRARLQTAALWQLESGHLERCP